jgi:hypothetical protein
MICIKFALLGDINSTRTAIFDPLAPKNSEGDSAGPIPDGDRRARMVARGTDRGEQVGASGHVERFAVRSDGEGERLMRLEWERPSCW